MSADKLSPKQELFIDEYMVDFCGKAAAERAGYAKASAKVTASRLLDHPLVIAGLNARRARMAAKAEVTRDRVIAEYAKLAFSDPRKFFNDDGTLKKVTELDEDTAAALAAFEVVEQQVAEGGPGGEIEFVPVHTKKVKWTDKKAALDSLCRVMGWNQDSVKLKGDAENPLTLFLQQVSGTAFAPVGTGEPETDA
ncbi:terminase small subunit [Caballeronia zhejiangensis]|uniref:Terminase n=1 Tax=Caballeronia zhejiangensis TaxID=871203 RepID=A0A656QFW3_9BURK|nr:terminase small subunit [Caballeronia zhejiangensis]KDR25946.1 terminase [Caballeronia zhejiangensis]